MPSQPTVPETTSVAPARRRGVVSRAGVVVAALAGSALFGLVPAPSAVANPVSQVQMKAVACSSSSTCLAVGNGALLTTDNGASWVSQKVPPYGDGALDAVACPSSTTCLAITTVRVSCGPQTAALAGLLGSFRPSPEATSALPSRAPRQLFVRP